MSKATESQLEKLAGLVKAGKLSQAEFDAAKKALSAIPTRAQSTVRDRLLTEIKAPAAMVDAAIKAVDALAEIASKGDMVVRIIVHPTASGYADRKEAKAPAKATAAPAKK